MVSSLEVYMKKIPSSALTERQLIRALKKEIREAGSARDWAIDHGITSQQVSAFLLGKQGAGVLIPKALGYKPVTIFIRKRD